MVTVFLSALRSIGLRLIASMAAKPFLEWALFWVLDLIVLSTKTPHDNLWLEKVKKAYYAIDKEPTTKS